MTRYFTLSQSTNFKFAYFNENLNKVHLLKSYCKKLLLIASLYSFFDFNNLNSKNHVLRIFFVGTYNFHAEEIPLANFYKSLLAVNSKEQFKHMASNT